MLNSNKFLGLSVVTLTATLSGCGSSDSSTTTQTTPQINPPPLTCNAPQIVNATGTNCIDPPPLLQCPAPKVLNDSQDACINPAPSIVAADNEAVLYYYRADGNYQDWTLHAWNNDSCDAYTDAFADDISWDNGAVTTGIDDNYGAYWLLPLKEGFGDCANFIIHNGGDKDPDDNDQTLALDGQRWSFVLSGVGTFVEPTLASDNLPTTISDAAAHWIDEHTLVWNTSGEAVKLLHSATAGLSQIGPDTITADNSITLQPATLTTAQKALVPHLQEWSAYSHDLPSEQVKSLLSEQLALVKVNDDGIILAASYVQAAKVLDDVYTSGSNDADEATLGASYNADGSITTAVWAPTAQMVTLKQYNADKGEIGSFAMSLDSNSGVWSHTLDASADRSFYRYQVSSYHPHSKMIETVEATDPYSVSLSSNGRYTQLVNLNDSDLKPSGWDDHQAPTIANLEDAVIIESHIRDFSANDDSVSAANRGKYMAFTETNSRPVQHLKALVEAGLTYFHLLPLNDIGTIKEDNDQRIELSNTVAQLCALNANAPVCGVESNDSTLKQVLQSYDTSSDKAQALVQSMRGLDGFNWGYDPHHFNAPEGSYASSADGISRIVELRAMVQALHQLGLRTALDVVYNHTTASALNDNSVFDKIVPGYYHRYDETSGAIIQSTCCENTASEHKMFAKFTIDSLVLWAKHYGFDSFRFDIMGHMPKQLLLDARAAVQQVDPDNYFYGEGWNWGEVVDNRLFEQASQENLADTEIGTFNDRSRDTIRQGKLFSDSVNLADQDHIRLGLAGTLKDYVLVDNHGNAKKGSSFSQSSYADDPADIINYVSKHDNRTLWDELQLSLAPTMSLNDRVRAQNIAATLPLVSQGIPFFQLGGDMLRSKSLDRNSYDAGDWFNQVDYTMSSNNWNVGLPLAQDNQEHWPKISALISNSETAPKATDIALAHNVFKEMLTIRNTSKLFRLTSADDVIARVGFHNTGSEQTPGLIVMSIDDGTGLIDLDPANDAIVVVVNGSNSAQTHSVNTASGFELHSILQNSQDSTVKTASFSQGEGNGSFNVPAYTTAVFVKPQGDVQGTGLAVNPNDVAAPYGDTAIFLRGVNSWDPVNQMSYDGNGVYSFTTELAAGDYSFKIADADWQTVNLGFSDVVIADSSIAASADGDGNLAITLSALASYKFSVDASATIPVVNIAVANQIISCNGLADSTDPYPFEVAGSGVLFVRGSHSGWNADSAYQFSYKGDNRYQAVAQFDGDFQFKLASDDGNWTTQMFATTADGSAIETADLALDHSYQVALGSAGTDNNQASLTAGSYSFLLTLNEANPTASMDVGRLVIQKCSNE